MSNTSLLSCDLTYRTNFWWNNWTVWTDDVAWTWKVRNTRTGSALTVNSEMLPVVCQAILVRLFIYASPFQFWCLAYTTRCKPEVPAVTSRQVLIFDYVYVCDSLSIAPAASPTGLQASNVFLTSTNLSWTAPDPRKQNGVIRAYVVAYKILESADNFTEEKTPTNDTSLLLENLAMNTTYTFKVKAITVADGPYSSLANWLTEEEGKFLPLRRYLTR